MDSYLTSPTYNEEGELKEKKQNKTILPAI